MFSCIKEMDELNNNNLIKKLGYGGYGDVYLVNDKKDFKKFFFVKIR